MTPDDIEKNALIILKSLRSGEVMSTNKLAAIIVGMTDAFDTKEAVKMVYSRLDELAHGVLKDCWRKGPMVMRFKRKAYPKQWHAPIVKLHVCPDCGCKFSA